MTESTRIRITSEEEYEWLNSVRQEYGLTWRGMMLKAEQRLLASEGHWPKEFQTPESLRAGNSVNPDDTTGTDGGHPSGTDEVVG
jgi:hypothetical protein